MIDRLLRKAWLQLLGAFLVIGSILTMYKYEKHMHDLSNLYEFKWAGWHLDSASAVSQAMMPTESAWYVITCCLIALALIRYGIQFSRDSIKTAAVAIWFILIIYRFLADPSAATAYAIAYETGSNYLPFLHPGAVTQALLAAAGFTLSLRFSCASLRPEDNRLLAILYAAVSHLLAGVLLAEEMKRLIQAAGLEPFASGRLVLLLAGGLYAWELFEWAAYSKQSIFRVLGSLMLLCAAIQTLVCEWPFQQWPFQAFVLFVLGAVTFCIAFSSNETRQSSASAGARMPHLIRESARVRCTSPSTSSSDAM
ncbi:hypothetical protein ACFQ88_09830 [Paenibacillus sp. NPDC056579]|uniref:hypothetical protein n=1 Tax=Paenibacillus sp. NPDC056579 TaxID=3345871 RepID=UPI0036AD1FED